MDKDSNAVAAPLERRVRPHDEPVAWAWFDKHDDNRLVGVLEYENPPLYVTPLYTRPAPAVCSTCGGHRTVGVFFPINQYGDAEEREAPCPDCGHLAG